MKRHIACAAAVAIMIAIAGCARDSKDGNVIRAKSDPVALQNQSRFKSRVEVKDHFASMIVCPEHNVSLVVDEQRNPECPFRRSAISAIDRMLDTGWTVEEIEDTVALFRQGRTPMAMIPGEVGCAPAPGTLKLDFFLMSHCPYTSRYVTDILPAINADLGQRITWEPHFIVRIDPAGKVISMRGDAEAEEDKFQVCVAREQSPAKWHEYAKCYSAAYSSEKAAAQRAGRQEQQERSTRMCAERAGVNYAETMKCVSGRSVDYLKKDAELVQRWRTSGSPSSVFNCSMRFQGGAVPYPQAKPHICALYPRDARPPACAN